MAGQIKCWGRNGSGQAPVPDEYAATTFRAVSAGEHYTCGLRAGAGAAGKVKCWGDPSDAENSRVIAELPPAETFDSISVGRYHVCGVRTNGTPLCWGGKNSTDAPGEVTFRRDYGQADMPEDLRDATFSQVSSAVDNTCGILDGQGAQTEGEVVCWGAEFTHDPLSPQKAGHGRTTPPDYTNPVPYPVSLLDAGYYHNCALTVDQDVACWGGGLFGQALLKGPFKALSVGALDTCAVRENDRLRCWGFNNYLGASGWTANPSTFLADNTAMVENLTTSYTFGSVAAGVLHTCGVLDGQNRQTDGQALRWGETVSARRQCPQKRTPNPIPSPG